MPSDVAKEGIHDHRDPLYALFGAYKCAPPISHLFSLNMAANVVEYSFTCHE